MGFSEKEMKSLILILICVGYLHPQGNTIPRRVDTLETSVDSLYTKTSHIVNVMDYIDSYDTTNGWQDAINAAINSVKSASGTRGLDAMGNTTSEILLPKGYLQLESPITLYSGIWLRGQGLSTELVEKAGFAGEQLIEYTGVAGYIDDTKITDMKFTTTNVRAIGVGSGTTVIGNSRIENITLKAVSGIILDEYTQFCIIKNIYSYGSIDTLLFLYGNANYVEGIDKEGGTGTSVGAYIYLVDLGVGTCVGNELHNILLEGNGSANKSGIIIRDADEIVLNNYWNETTTSDGYMLRIEGSGRIYIKGYFQSPYYPNNLLKVDSTWYVTIDDISSDAQENDFYDFIVKDTLSSIFINTLHTRGYYSPYRLDKLNDGFIINEVYSKLDYANTTYYSPIYKPQFSGDNRFSETFENQLLDFTPDDLSNLYMWFDGNYGLTTNGWMDKAGTGSISKEFHPMIYVTIDDTIPINFYNSATTWDSIKYKVDDSVRVQFTFGTNGTGTNILSITDTLTGTGTITTFNDATIPANSEVQMYFVFLGDAANKLWFDIYKDGSATGRNMTFYNSPTISSHNSIPNVIFNGIDEYGVVDSSGLDQPITIYMVWKANDFDSLNRVLTGYSVYPPVSNMAKYYWLGANQATILHGGTSQIQAVPSENTYMINKLVLDSANSIIQFNKGSETTGNIGNGDLFGLALGRGGLKNEDTTLFSAMSVSEIIVYDTTLTNYQNDLVNDYLNKKYNIGLVDWAYSVEPDTVSNSTSDVASGEMTRFVWNDTVAVGTVYRNFTITSGMIGKQLTFSVYAKVDTGFCAPYIFGCGITGGSNMRIYDNGWGIITQTFTPQSAGQLAVGINFYSVHEAYIDEPYLTTTVR
jgi:hypothetical protein